ncbi:MAG TPA: CHRD domain-containing protein [Candidatus Polarisedimenticolaceae bacterium]|nr:CHRD domain-containing protein [Candidatus Polarisedimenticolaceae bacterium]
MPPESEHQARRSGASVIGPASQGIATGEFEEMVKALQAGSAYVNVHTTSFAPGEIRGQVK